MTPHGLERNRLVCPWRFSRQEYWSGLPFCPPGDLPNPGIEPSSLTLQTGSLPSEPPGNYMLLFSRSVVSDSVTQWIAACQASLSFTISWSLLKLMTIESWCHPTISSSVIPFSSCLQFSPAAGSFLMSWRFTSGGQSIGASVSASVLSMNIQGWFPLGLTGLISLQSKGLSIWILGEQYSVLDTAPNMTLEFPT